MNTLTNEPVHDETYNMICETSEDSDQNAHLRSLIRVFADRIGFLQPPGYPKRDKRDSLPYWMDVQADLNLSGHTCLIKGFVVRWLK